MAVLREPGVWLERSTRLRRQPQHRRSRHGLSHDFSRNREVCRISHDLAGGQALLVHRAGRDAAVAIAGDKTPPVRGQTRLLCWLVPFSSFMHFPAQDNAFCSFNVSTKKARAE